MNEVMKIPMNCPQMERAYSPQGMGSQKIIYLAGMYLLEKTILMQ